MKTVHVKFALFRPTLVLPKSYEKKYQQTKRRIEELNKLLPEGWTASNKVSAKLWSEKRDRLEEAGQNKGSAWELADVIRDVMTGKIENKVISVYGEKIELDKNSFYERENGRILAFQFTKLRADGIPAKKKIGKKRSDIVLDEDEYIGEFTEVVFDTVLNVFAIQVNKYGVGARAIASYMNSLYKEYRGEEWGKYIIGEMEAILDPDLITVAMQAHAYKRVHLRCSDVNKDAIIPEDSTTWYGVKNVIGEKTGVVVELTMSIKNTDPRDDNMKKDIVALAEQYHKFINDAGTSKDEAKESKLELTIVNEADQSEVVDFMIPKKNFIVSMQVQERVPVGSEYMCNEAVNYYMEYVAESVTKLLWRKKDEKDQQKAEEQV